MKAWVYIDGFNLYNGLLQKSPYKWLDLFRFAQALLPNDEIERVKYFTARVQARVADPDQPLRQIVYWRALRTLPQVEIIEGHFLSKRTMAPTAASLDDLARRAAHGEDLRGQRPRMVEVVRTEEKGTDVNLAVHLVHDAHLGRFEAALIVSNDSDLQEAIRIVKEDLGKVVGVFTPRPARPSAELQKIASFFRRIQKRALRDCQLPDTMTDGRGEFSRPREW